MNQPIYLISYEYRSITQGTPIDAAFSSPWTPTMEVSYQHPMGWYRCKEKYRQWFECKISKKKKREAYRILHWSVIEPGTDDYREAELHLLHNSGEIWQSSLEK